MHKLRKDREKILLRVSRDRDCALGNCALEISYYARGHSGINYGKARGKFP